MVAQRFFSLTLAVLFFSVDLYAQTATTTEKPMVQVYGFIRNYFHYDSRQTYTSTGGEYNMIPYDSKWNEDHSADLNDVDNTSLQALTTRIGLRISGPDFFGMKSRGVIESDFGGFGDYNHQLRLRLAYIQLEKLYNPSEGRKSRRSMFLIGQAWHPLSGDVMPEVLGMAVGAPFRPHSRTPQLRATFQRGYFSVTAAFLYQLQYTNSGPTGPDNLTSVGSTRFANNAIVPETYLGFQYHGEYFSLTMGGDIQVLTPRTHAVVDGITRPIHESVVSFTPHLKMDYRQSKLHVQAHSLLAQNTSHLNQLVGYGISGFNTDGSYEYVPLRAAINYLNIAIGSTMRANLFFGHFINLGASQRLYSFSTNDDDYRIYLKGGTQFTHLHSFWRIAPSLSYNLSSVAIGLEYELTVATYGNLDAYGAVSDNANRHSVSNHRICALVKYNF